jgi:hypothetical protein
MLEGKYLLRRSVLSCLLLLFPYSWGAKQLKCVNIFLSAKMGSFRNVGYDAEPHPLRHILCWVCLLACCLLPEKVNLLVSCREFAKEVMIG